MNSYRRFARNNNLQKLRKERGLSQKDLACYCKQTASRISDYENGNVMPRYDVIRMICNALEVMADEIYPQLQELDKHVDNIRQIKCHVVH